MQKILYPLTTVMLLIICGGILLGCGDSNADKVNENLGKECEKFECQRRIIAINGITDKPLLDVEGRCSIEKNDALGGNVLELICKMGPDDYRKHFIGLSDNVTFTSTQLKGLDVSEYRTKFIIRPESIVPDVDLVTGDGG
jgi:hypothetical protein